MPVLIAENNNFLLQTINNLKDTIAAPSGVEKHNHDVSLDTGSSTFN
jgi:hypothetical protein